MIFSNAMQLKAVANKKAHDSGITTQLVLQYFMMERFLERLSLSEYKNKIILKGGFLISGIVGIETRSTMDIDTTISGFTLDEFTAKTIVQNICDIPVNDGISFIVSGSEEIRESHDYPGIRIKLKAEYKPMSVAMSIDITTGDPLTPGSIAYEIPMIFENRTIQIFGYNIETILAEKIETILARSTANTRMRDFYDAYILHVSREQFTDMNVFKKAILDTAAKRNTDLIIPDYSKILSSIGMDTRMNDFWQAYRESSPCDISVELQEICSIIEKMMDTVFK